MQDVEVFKILNIKRGNNYFKVLHLETKLTSIKILTLQEYHHLDYFDGIRE